MKKNIILVLVLIVLSAPVYAGKIAKFKSNCEYGGGVAVDMKYVSYSQCRYPDNVESIQYACVKNKSVESIIFVKDYSDNEFPIYENKKIVDIKDASCQDVIELNALRILGKKKSVNAQNSAEKLSLIDRALNLVVSKEDSNGGAISDEILEKSGAQIPEEDMSTATVLAPSIR